MKQLRLIAERVKMGMRRDCTMLLMVSLMVYCLLAPALSPVPNFYALVCVLARVNKTNLVVAFDETVNLI